MTDEDREAAAVILSALASEHMRVGATGPHLIEGRSWANAYSFAEAIDAPAALVDYIVSEAQRAVSIPGARLWLPTRAERAEQRATICAEAEALLRTGWEPGQ